MLRRTIRRGIESTHHVRRDAYHEQSSLPVDFFRMCHHRFGVQYFHPVLLGLRSNEMRGLFLPEGHYVKRNEVVAAIPLKSVLTNDSIMQEDGANKEITVDLVRDAIPDQEMKLLAPQLHLGVQLAHMASNLPDRTKGGSAEGLSAADEVLRDGINPWVRMIDDENYLQEWVDSTYAGRGLDNIQTKSYNELNGMMKRTSGALHEKLPGVTTSIDNFRRLLRVVLARSDVTTPESYYSKNPAVRRFKAIKRRVTGAKLPQQNGIIPLADMLNHSNRPNVTSRIELNSKHLGGEHAILLHSIKDINEGEELCRHYNFAMTRDAALFRYGFLPYELLTIQENNHFETHIQSQRKNHLSAKAPLVAEREREAAEKASELEQIFKKMRQPHKE